MARTMTVEMALLNGFHYYRISIIYASLDIYFFKYITIVMYCNGISQVVVYFCL